MNGLFFNNDASDILDKFVDNIWLEFNFSGCILAAEAVAGTQVCTWEEKRHLEQYLDQRSI